MSDPIDCETCGKMGPRRLGTCAPEGWLYAEVVDSDPDQAHLDKRHRVFIIAVCSEECAMSMWKPGPGKLDLTQDI